jgi:hypothetical protein
MINSMGDADPADQIEGWYCAEKPENGRWVGESGPNECRVLSSRFARRNVVNVSKMLVYLRST